MSTTPLLQVTGLVKRFGALAATDHANTEQAYFDGFHMNYLL